MKKKLKAFTLAEVLITLAIIGVVAALTIPTVINNYQRKMYVTGLKKSYNNLTNGFRGYMAQEGVTKLSDTTLWATMPDGGISTEDLLNGDNQEFLNAFERIFKVLSLYGNTDDEKNKLPNYNDLNGGSTTGAPPVAMYLADGTFVYFSFKKEPSRSYCDGGKECLSLEVFQRTYNTSTKFWESLGQVVIDINGLKGPNVTGRDLFLFYLGDDGNLHPAGGREAAEYRTGSTSGATLDTHWKDGGCEKNDVGLTCAGRIMENGWGMNY